VWLKALLPVGVVDCLQDVAGANKSMDTFEGKRKLE